MSTPNKDRLIISRGFDSLHTGDVIGLDPYFNLSSQGDSVIGLCLVVEKDPKGVVTWNFENQVFERIASERLMQSTYILVEGKENEIR